jgi:hypothetical protein
VEERCRGEPGGLTADWVFRVENVVMLLVLSAPNVARPAFGWAGAVREKEEGLALLALVWSGLRSSTKDMQVF